MSNDMTAELLNEATLAAWIASGTEILTARERERYQELLEDAERQRQEQQPRLDALRAQVPAWAHEFIALADDDGHFTIAVPGVAPIKAGVWADYDSGGLRVAFADISALTTGGYWWYDYNEPAFAVALARARRAQEKQAEVAARGAEPQPSKWANLDPTRSALEAIDNGEYGEAGAFALLAVARELRTIGGILAAQP